MTHTAPQVDRFALPPNLPVPENDGAADHLAGATLPSIALPASNGSTVNLADLSGRTVVFAYPKTGDPEKGVPDDWDTIREGDSALPWCDVHAGR